MTMPLAKASWAVGDMVIVSRRGRRRWPRAAVPIAAVQGMHADRSDPNQSPRNYVIGFVQCSADLRRALQHQCQADGRVGHMIKVLVVRSHNVPDIYDRIARAAAMQFSAPIDATAA